MHIFAMMEILISSLENMKERIREAKSRIAALEDLLSSETGKNRDKINEEIANAKFDLKQMMSTTNVTICTSHSAASDLAK